MPDITTIKNLLPNWVKPVARRILQTVRFLRWLISSLLALPVSSSENRQRILAIYDTSSQPFSVGDLLTVMEGSLVLCKKHDINCVDLAIIYDPADPARSDAVFKESITNENILYHLASILPIAQVNPKLGSLLVFNSQLQLHKYLGDNQNDYVVWPSGWHLGSRKYLSPVVFNDLLHEHFKDYGEIPNLECRPFLRGWAQEFYRQHASPRVPVTVNLRNNKKWHVERNSNFKSWMELFHYCEDRYEVAFVVICAYSEIDDEMRTRKNVLFSKDFHTGIEQDMALISESAFHMGAGSGPATMAWFSDKPYLMVNTTYKEGEFYERPGMIRRESEAIQKFWFAKDLQSIANNSETPELLISEFQKMWASIDIATWQRQQPDKGEEGSLHGWLR